MLLQPAKQKIKVPLDVRIIVVLTYVAVVVGLIAASGIFPLSALESEYYRVPFGLWHVTTPDWIRICALLYVFLRWVMAYGLRRTRAYAWWITVILGFDDIGRLIAEYMDGSERFLFARLAINLFFFIWCYLRIPLYRPFGKAFPKIKSQD